MRPFRSLRWRLLVLLELGVLGVMIVLALMLSAAVRRTWLAQLEEQLAGEARLIGHALAPAMAAGPPEGGLDAEAHRYAALLGAQVAFIGPDGTVWGASREDQERVENLLDRPEIRQALATGRGASIRFDPAVGYEVMYVAVPVEAEGRGTGVVRVALPLQRVQASVARLQWTVGLTTVLFVGLIGVLAFLRMTPTLGTIRDLSDALGRLTAGDLEARVFPRTDDELGDLARVYNQMTERLRETILALREEQSRLAGLLERMTDGVLITDGEGQVRLINPAAARMLGISPEDAIGRSFVQVVWDHRLVELWEESRKRGQEEVSLIDLAPRRPVVFQAVVTPLEGEGGAALVLLQDLTRVRELETVRRDFVANVSHELRTPLTTLKALVETLREALEEPQTAHRFLERIEGEVDRMDRIVGELLELAQIESGRMPLQMARMEMAAVIGPPVEELRPLAERAGLTLTVHVAPDLPPVLVDGDGMRRVVANLVRNAIQFTPSGEVRVEAERVGDEVVISVRDTGVGIAPEDLPRIFERFYKARESHSRGAGLGLAIAKHIVLAHGGRIWAESTPGRGSTFFVALPVQE
ncbi:MAG: ATP-binding protein [Anaerolineae bacterium]|nr:cell wall metabolism sensor histidine kinase WalK [Anaerolineae bacterium]MDW8067419.1 ATP-binding protein [Anaerolineae bacterium]